MSFPLSHECLTFPLFNNAYGSENKCSHINIMVKEIVTTAASDQSQLCPACQTITQNTQDRFCRRCGCRLNLNCKYCHSKIRPLDKFCPSCGSRHLIIVEQIKQGIIMHSPYIAIASATILLSAWLALRYSLRNKL